VWFSLYEAIRFEGALADLSLNSLKEGRWRVESGEGMIRERKGEEYRVEIKKWRWLGITHADDHTCRWLTATKRTRSVHFVHPKLLLNKFQMHHLPDLRSAEVRDCWQVWVDLIERISEVLEAKQGLNKKSS
jgi:hypothetical protein